MKRLADFSKRTLPAHENDEATIGEYLDPNSEVKLRTSGFQPKGCVMLPFRTRVVATILHTCRKPRGS
jgi:hypothetical protein